MTWLFSQALIKDYANSPCSQAQVVEYSAATCSDGALSAQLSVMPTQHKFWRNDKTMEPSQLSRFGLTCAVLTESHGEDLLTWFRAGFPVRHSQLPRLDETMLMTYGHRCGESWQMCIPGLSMPRTYRQKQSTLLQMTASRWVTKPDAWKFPRQTWAQTTKGLGTGYLHTPTTKANYCAESMQKWPSCRAWRETFGKVQPEYHEYLMDWPTGWTDLRPLETGSWQSWLQRHSQ